MHAHTQHASRQAACALSERLLTNIFVLNYEASWARNNTDMHTVRMRGRWWMLAGLRRHVYEGKLDIFETETSHDVELVKSVNLFGVKLEF